MKLIGSVNIVLTLSTVLSLMNMLCQKVHTMEAKADLYVLSLLPYPSSQGDSSFQPVSDEGPPIYLAGELAVELINNNSDILNGYTLKLLQGDGGCNLVSTTTISLIENLFYKNKTVVGILGPSCSSSALFVSKIISTSERAISIPTIHLGGSPRFAKREAFPYSFSMVDFAKVFADAVVALMHMNGWKNVIILYDESNIYYTTILEYFQQTFRPETTIAVASVIYANYIPINEIKQSLTRVILLLVEQDMFNRILCIALSKDIIHPTYQWVFISKNLNDLKPISLNFEGIQLSCDLEQMQMAANLSFYIRYHDKSINRTKPTHSGLTQMQFRRRYSRRINNYNHKMNATLKPNFSGTFYFDSVWAMALAINNSIDELRSQGIELADFQYEQNQITDSIGEQLLHLSFEGVSGFIKFDNVTGFVSRGIDILQLQQNELKLLLYFNGTDLTVIGKNATLYAIEDNFNRFGTLQKVPAYMCVICLVITTFVLILIASFHFVSVLYRNSPSVKASNLKIVHVAYCGCYLTVISITCNTAATLLHTHTERKCELVQAALALVFCGMNLIYSTICVRTFRLYRIFVHFINPGRFISDKALFLFVSLCIVVELPVIFAWSFADPVHPEIRRNPSLKLIRVQCSSDSLKVWFLTLLGYNALLLFLSCYFALRCSKVSQKGFKNNSILILAYILSIELTVGIGLYFLLPQGLNPLPEYLTINVTLILYIFTCWALLFMPPISFLFNRDLKLK